MLAGRLQIIGGNLDADVFFAALTQIIIASQSVERERIRVQMVLQVKDLRETGASKLGFVPGAVVVLMRNEPLDGALDGRIVRANAFQKTDQAPGCLRGGTLPFRLQSGIVVGEDGLAEATIGVLDRAEPFHG